MHLLRRRRAVAQLSALGGVAGGLGGAAFAVVVNFTAGLGLGYGVLNQAVMWGGVSAAMVAVFGGILTTLGPRVSLASLTPWKGGLLGALTGVAVFGAIAFAGTGSPAPLLGRPFLTVLMAALGGTLGGGLVAMGRAAPEALEQRETPKLGHGAGR